MRKAARELRRILAFYSACVCLLLDDPVAAAGEAPALDAYPCFELLQRLHAGSAAGGILQGIGELYFLPGSQADEAGLYVLTAEMSRFVIFGPPPTRSKDDFVLIVEVVSYRQYAFVIRFQGPGSRFETRGWSIEENAVQRQRPKKEKRVTVLLGGRDPEAEDAIAAEIRAAIPRLSDPFHIPFTDDLHPIYTTFVRDFDSAFHTLLECTRTIHEGDQELQVAAALEQVELLGCLERAVSNVIRNGQDSRWRQDHEAELAEEMCRRLDCRDDPQRHAARLEARRLVEEFGRLQRLIASVRVTHGERWKRPLLRQLLQGAQVDSVTIDAVLERM